MGVSDATGPVHLVALHATAPDDLRSLYQAEFGSLVALARLLVGNTSLAEELVQDTFARLVERPPRLQAADSLSSYVRAALLNSCRSKIRRAILERKHATPAPKETTDSHPDLALREALLTLPMRQRQCVALRFYEDRTVDDIAGLLGVSAGSVKTHIHRGLTSLRQLLEDES